MAESNPPKWDLSRLETARCDVANAANAGADVVVHFGRREDGDQGEAGVSLARTMQLTPYAAKRLQELLAVLVHEHDKRRENPR